MRQWDGAKIREKDYHFKAGNKPNGFDTNQVFPVAQHPLRRLLHVRQNRPSKAGVNKKIYTFFCSESISNKYNSRLVNFLQYVKRLKLLSESDNVYILLIASL
jgi:hypothetical protein